MRALSSTDEARGFLSSSMLDESESEEWWFEVRPDGVGRKQPRPIGELCSVSADSSTPDATSARWYETFATRVASSQSTRQSGSSGLARRQPRSRKSRRSGGDTTVGRETRSEGRTQKTFSWCWRQPRWPKALARLQANDRPMPNGRSLPGWRCRRRPQCRSPPRY